MEITGLTPSEFWSVVNTVSDGHYEGNLVTKDVHSTGGVRRPRIRGRIAVTNSRGPGARRSWSGRHGPWASWQAYRDVLTELFHRYPEARVRTGLAVYNGREGFEETFPATGYHNVGSMIEPVTMPELSVWPDPGRWAPDGRTAATAVVAPEPEAEAGYVRWSGSGDAADIRLTGEPYPFGPDILDDIDRTLEAVTSGSSV